MLKAYIYQSKALVTLNKEEFRSLSEVAINNNRVTGITGFLFFYRGHYVQYIEGSSDALIKLIDTLKRDSRHKIICEFHQTINNRLFPKWQMGLLRSDHVRFEHILMKQFRVLTMGMGDDTRWQNLVWSTVDSLAQFQRDTNAQKSLLYSPFREDK